MVYQVEGNNERHLQSWWGVGLVIMPLVITGLISTYGWRTSFAILGIIALVIIVSATQFLRRDPSQMQQLPDGEAEAIANSVNSVEQGLSLDEAVHTRQFWTICAAYLTALFCVNTIVIHIPQHAVDLGISTTNAAGFISTIGGASIFGRLVMGNTGDRIGNKWAMMICFLILTMSLSWFQLATELWMLYLFAAVYGFSHGGFFAVISPLIAWLFGTSSHGVIFGVVSFVGQIGGFSGPILAGRIFDITDSYQLAFLILLAFAIVGLISSATLRPINAERG